MKGRIPPAEFVRRFNPLRAAVGHEPLGETTFVSGHRPGQPTHLQGRVRAPGRTNTHALLEAAPTVVDQTRLVESDQRRVAVIPRVEVTREDLEDVAAWMSELRRRGQVFERGRRIEGLLRSTGPSGTAPSGAGGCGSRGGGGVGSTGFDGPVDDDPEEEDALGGDPPPGRPIDEASVGEIPPPGRVDPDLQLNLSDLDRTTRMHGVALADLDPEEYVVGAADGDVTLADLIRYARTWKRIREMGGHPTRWAGGAHGSDGTGRADDSR